MEKFKHGDKIRIDIMSRKRKIAEKFYVLFEKNGELWWRDVADHKFSEIADCHIITKIK